MWAWCQRDGWVIGFHAKSLMVKIQQLQPLWSQKVCIQHTWGISKVKVKNSTHETA